MQKVKVYDVKKLIYDQIGKRPYRDDKLLIVVGKYGVVVRDYEGCGWNVESIFDSISIPVNDIDLTEEGKFTIPLVPQYEVEITIDDILRLADYEVMELKTFLCKWNYNDRCRANFSETLSAIEAMGVE